MDFIVGGYYMIQSGQLQKWMNAGLLPDMLWSASRCICEKVPDAWILPWNTNPDPSKDREKLKNALGLSNSEFIELQEQFNKLLREESFGYPNVYMSYQLMQKYYFQYFYKLPNIKMISIALPEGEVQNFIDEFKPQGNIAENGVRKLLRRNQPLEEYANPIGFEVLGYDYADFHSMICGSMEQEILQNYGIRFNRYGLLDSFEYACEIIRDVREGKLLTEEGYWAPWLVSEYSV
jgi:hypothetical protein